MIYLIRKSDTHMLVETQVFVLCKTGMNLTGKRFLCFLCARNTKQVRVTKGGLAPKGVVESGRAGCYVAPEALRAMGAGPKPPYHWQESRLLDAVRSVMP